MIALIYARSQNRVIGRDGRLPWRLPDDFTHFKQTTMGRPIIMGRRTFEDHHNVLPGRTNIVLSRDPAFTAPPGMVIKRSLNEALADYRHDPDEVFIIGGAQLFADAFHRASRVYETVVHADVEGDTVLPPLDLTDWTPKVLQQHGIDAKHAHAFTVTQWDRVH